MSTFFWPSEPLPLEKLLRALPEMALEEDVNLFTTESTRCITNQIYFLWVYKMKNSIRFVRYGLNQATPIIDLIEQNFNLEIISEHDY